MRPRSGLARDEGAFFKGLGVLWVLPTPLERQGTLACPAGAPFLGKKWGKEPPGEEVPPPGPPSLAVSYTHLDVYKRQPQEVQWLIEQGNLSAGHGRALLSLPAPEEQIQFAGEIMEKGYSCLLYTSRCV